MLAEVNLQEADLSEASLSGADLSQSSLQMSSLRRAVLKGTGLNNANLEFSNLTGANLRGARLEEANLSGAKLPDADLRGAVLKNAKLEGADLSGCRLQRADLSRTRLDWTVPGKVDLAHADLTGADLTDADLSRSDLSETIFRNALLIRARLGETKTAGMRLGGAVVTNALLPEQIRVFDVLHSVAESSRVARKLYAWLLAGLAFSALTLAATGDAQLLTNATSSPLPVIQTPFPTANFYWYAPVILLALYLYFHLQLQHQWRLISRLPAVFPDGTPLDEKIFPWLLNTWVRNFSSKLSGRNKRSSLAASIKRNLGLESLIGRVRNFLVVGMCWYAVPVFLAALWARYLPRHDWAGTRLQIVILSLSIVFAIALHFLAKQTLRNKKRPSWGTLGLILLCTLPVLAVTSSLSHKAIEGDLNTDTVKLRWLPWEVSWLPAGYTVPLPRDRGFAAGVQRWLRADIAEQIVSDKPANYDPGDPDQLKWVRGARLHGANLNHLIANAAFLNNAKLNAASLRRANLYLAQLQGASLRGADLSGVDLRFADLSHADLTGADLTGADLRETLLVSADLTGVNFNNADLANADVSNTVFYDAQNLKKEQVQLAIHWREGYYENAFKKQLRLPVSGP